MQMCVEVRGHPQGSFCQSCPPYFSHWDLGFLSWKDWARESGESFSVCLPGAGITQCNTDAWLLTGVLGIKLRSSSIRGKHFINRAISPTPRMYSLLIGRNPPSAPQRGIAQRLPELLGKWDWLPQLPVTSASFLFCNKSSQSLFTQALCPTQGLKKRRKRRPALSGTQ